MSRGTSPLSECPPGVDDSVLSIKGQPKRFSKPARPLKSTNFDDVLNDSLTEVSVISAHSPVKLFKPKKNNNPSHQNFTKALETTYDSTFHETERNSERFFKPRKEIAKKDQTFSKAFETTSENSFFVNVQGNAVAKSFRSKKGTSKDFQKSKTFSNALQTTNESFFEDCSISSQTQTTFRAANFKSRKGSSEKDHTFSNAFKADRKGLKHDNESGRESSLASVDVTIVCIESPEDGSNKRCRNNAFKHTCKSQPKNQYSRALDITVEDCNSYLENETDLSQENPPMIKFSQSLSPISPTRLEMDNSNHTIETAEASSENIQTLPRDDFTEYSDSVSNNSSNTSKSLDFSTDFVPILNEIKSEMDAGNISTKRSNSSKTRKKNRVPNETCKIDDECRKNTDNDDRNLSKFCLPKRPLRKKSSNTFTDHDLSLYLLSKGCRPKKPIPQHVDKSLRLEPGQKRQGKENKITGRIKRPSYWATNKLYTFLETTLVPRKAESFVVYLADVVAKSVTCPDIEERCRLVNSLKFKMAKLKLVKSDFYFYDFIFEFLPLEFQDIAVPCVLLFSEKLNIPNFKRENLFSRYF